MRHVITLLSLLTPFLHASTCPDIRLDKTLLKTVPVMDQDDSGFCWCYGAAAAIDAYRFSHGDTQTNRVTSPVELCARAVKNGRGKNGDGTIQAALEEARDTSKTCDHYAVSKAFRSTDFALDYAEPTAMMDAEEFTCPTQVSWAASIFASRKIAVKKRELDVAQASRDMAKICSDASSIPVALPVPFSKKITDIPVGGVQNFLNGLLSAANPQPIGIHYCGDVLTDPPLTMKVFDGAFKGCTRGHASTIVGSRPGPHGQCEYLVRESAGVSCDAYKKLEKPRDCERGQVWVGNIDLQMNVKEFVWMH